MTHVTHVTLPEESAGARILDDLTTTLCRFVAFPSDHAAIAVALWIVHTHALDAFDSSPRLALLSPEPQSGKTRTLEVIEHTASAPMLTSNTTVAVLARGLDAGTFVTVLLDECDTVFGSKAKGDEDLRGLLNSGHRRGAQYMRMVGEGARMDAKAFSTFSAVAMAGIGDLPDTVLQRSVVLRMRRRARHESVEPFRRRLHGPQLEDLRNRVSTWALAHVDSLRNRWPDMPEGVTDRPADVWEPLLAIADEAGGNWPQAAREACVSLVTEAHTTDSGSLGVRLLGDLRAVWTPGAETMLTADILARLTRLDEAPWADLRGNPLDARGLARRLRQYGVTSGSVRCGDVTGKGYRRDEMHDAWSRYLPALTDGSQGSQPSLAPRATVTLVTDVTPLVSAACLDCGEPLPAGAAAYHRGCGGAA